jgi:hypothetical protein
MPDIAVVALRVTAFGAVKILKVNTSVPCAALTAV